MGFGVCARVCSVYLLSMFSDLLWCILVWPLAASLSTLWTLALLLHVVVVARLAEGSIAMLRFEYKQQI